MHIALYEPEIPPNTGNIMRLCANTGSRLHLIGSLGFSLDDRQLRRAGLDYRDLADVETHNDFADFIQAMGSRRLFACTTRGSKRYDTVAYTSEDVLLFGPESRGLPQAVLGDIDPVCRIRIPMRIGSRSLNLANAVAVILYESLRQQDYCGMT